MGCGASHVSPLNTMSLDHPTKLPESFAGKGLEQLPSSWKALLGSVATLNLSDNRLRDLPSDLAELPLAHLDVSGNPALRELPASLQTMETLTSLSLAGCDFEELPECVYGMPQLSSLDLSDNPRLQLSVHLRMLYNLTHLTILNSGFYFFPGQVRDLTHLVSLRIGGRPGHPIRLNRTFPRLPACLEELEMHHVDYRGLCCYRDPAGFTAFGVGAATPLSKEGARVATYAHTPKSAVSRQTQPQQAREKERERKRGMGASSASAASVTERDGGTVGVGGSTEGAEPSALGSRRPSVGGSRFTGAGLSSLVPNFVVSLMAARRGSGLAGGTEYEESSLRTTDLPDALLELTRLRRLTLRHMHLRSLGGIARLQRLEFLDVERNNIRYVTSELSLMPRLATVRLGYNLITDFFVERGFPAENACELLTHLGPIPPGCPGLQTISDLHAYLTRATVVLPPSDPRLRGPLATATGSPYSNTAGTRALQSSWASDASSPHGNPMVAAAAAASAARPGGTAGGTGEDPPLALHLHLSMSAKHPAADSAGSAQQKEEEEQERKDTPIFLPTSRAREGLDPQTNGTGGADDKEDSDVAAAVERELKRLGKHHSAADDASSTPAPAPAPAAATAAVPAEAEATAPASTA